MSRLVQPELATPRQSQLRQPPPSGFGDSRERGTLGGQLSHGCVQVVAHQVQLVYRRAVHGQALTDFCASGTHPGTVITKLLSEAKKSRRAENGTNRRRAPRSAPPLVYA